MIETILKFLFLDLILGWYFFIYIGLPVGLISLFVWSINEYNRK